MNNLSYLLRSILFAGFSAIFITGQNIEAALTGQSMAAPGELARFDSDVESDWFIMPVENQSGVYIDTNKKTLLLASPNEGTIYIFAASVDPDGKPKADVATLTITKDSKIIVTPLPPVETSIEALVKDGTKDCTTAEKQALANSFSIVCTSIDNKTITTATSAREAFRKQWLYESGRLQNRDKLNGFLTLISEALKTDDLQVIRTQYGEAVKALGFVIKEGK